MSGRRWQHDQWPIPEGLDAECKELCAAINEAMDGVLTVESCCGHGKEPYRIWCVVKSLRAAQRLAYWMRGCHSGVYGWQVIAHSDCGTQLSFMIEGTTGEDSYTESLEIAKVIREECGR